MIKVRVMVGAMALSLLALTGTLAQAGGPEQVRADTSWGRSAQEPSPEAPEGPEAPESGGVEVQEDTSWG